MRLIEYKSPDMGDFDIHVVQSVGDLHQVKAWLEKHPVVGLDTETSGLDIYAAEHKLRTVQFGDGKMAYVVPYRPEYRLMLQVMLMLPDGLVIHNAPYDTQVLAKHLGLDMKTLWTKVVDTKVFSHLVDSRNRKDLPGLGGHKLEELVARYLSEQVAEEIKGYVTRACREMKITKARYFAEVPIDDEDYLRYAGMDPILNMLLYQHLAVMVPRESQELIAYEHQLLEEMTQVSQRGWLLDVERTQLVGLQLEGVALDADDTAWDWYCDNVDSPKQVIQALEYAGIQLDGRLTPGGQPKVDKKFLESVDHPLTKAISTSKRATKWRSSYIDNFLANVGQDLRVHPVINTLAARTARFSVQDPALQTLPSDDPLVKDCLVAEEGYHTWAVDYEAQELRIGAALSGDRRMIQAFLNNEDLHTITAEAAGVSRDIGKMANYLIVYGGGWRALVEQGGVSESVAKRVIEAFRSTYPDLHEFGRECASEARSRGYVTTRMGRRLYVDVDRAYSAVNYRIQNEGREMTCQGILRLSEGERRLLRMAVHDEIVGVALYEDQVREIMKKMEDRIGAVDIPVSGKFGGRSWGSLYSEGQYVKI